jgi:hypothetical protein
VHGNGGTRKVDAAVCVEPSIHELSPELEFVILKDTEERCGRVAQWGSPVAASLLCRKHSGFGRMSLVIPHCGEDGGTDAKASSSALLAGLPLTVTTDGIEFECGLACSTLFLELPLIRRLRKAGETHFFTRAGIPLLPSVSTRVMEP